MEQGCDKLIVVLTRERGYVKTEEKAIRLTNRLYKRYPNIVEGLNTRAERYNASMQHLMELEQEGKVFIIAPETTFGVGRTDTDIPKLRCLYDAGHQIAKEQMAALRSYLAE